MFRHTAFTAEAGYRTPKSGTVRWYRLQDFPRVSDDGRKYFSGAFIDITAVKETESRSRRADRILAEHIRNTPLAVLEWDEGFRLTRWSGQAEAIFGWTAEEVVGLYPHEWRFVHEADIEPVNEVIRQLTSQEKRHNFSVNRNYHKSGRVLVCEWHNSIVFDEDGRVISLLSLTQDLTAIHHTQAELVRSRERLLTALRFSATLCFDYDLQTHESYVSQPPGQFVGLTELADDYNAIHDLRIVHPEDRKLFLSAFARVVEAPEHDPAGLSDIGVEFRGVAADGSGRPRWFLIQGSLIRDADGHPSRIVGLVTEITQRKRAEEERQARDRQALETRRYESLGVLAGGVAHDFNNLLTVVMGNTALLRSSAQPGDPIIGPISEIEAASQRAADLCRQLTAYAGTGQLYLHPVDLSDMVRDTGPAVFAMARTAPLSFHLAVGLPLVRAELFQFRQLLVNLVANASEAYPSSAEPGPIRIETAERILNEVDRLTYAAAPPAGRYVALRVIDDGEGIPESEISKIFDPFYSTKFAGRGLGLAAVLGIARGHKGGVRITSSSGRGTTVEVVFPAHQGHCEEPVQIIDLPAARPPEARAPDAGRKVLIVDDEPSVREVIAGLLQDEGFVTITAAEGNAAFSAFGQNAPSVCLAVVDMMMPGFSGTEVIRRLREMKPQLPVILTTGYVDRDLSAGLSRSGPTVLLSKPFTVDQLLAAVSDALKN